MSNILNLNESAIRQANSQSHFNAGNNIVNDAEITHRNGLEVFKPQDDWTNEQREYAISREVEWASLVSKAFNDSLSRRASWVPWSVAGRSNYPAAQMNKKVEAQRKAEKEWDGKMERFLTNTRKQLALMVPASQQIKVYRYSDCGTPISSDDPVALEKLKARHEYLTTEHAKMKGINAWYRKYKTCKGYECLSDEAAAKLDDAVSAGYSWETTPFPSFTLSNNNANIKRIAGRIKTLEVTREHFANNDTTENYDGLAVHKNVDSNRVQLVFNEKPDASTRSILKSYGFRWSPKAIAWQRQLNGAGIRAVRDVVKELGLTPAQTIETMETLTLDEFAERYAK